MSCEIMRFKKDLYWQGVGEVQIELARLNLGFNLSSVSG